MLPQGGFKYLDQNDLLNFFNRLSVEWNKTLHSIHEFNVLAGEEIRFTNRSTTNSTGIGVVYESGGIAVTHPKIIEFFNLQDIDYYGLRYERDRFIGFFFNGAYAYKSRYVANFTVRYDGSNQLGESDAARFLPTWNVSGAWNIYNEPFFKNSGFLSSTFNYMKFRTTYGISGNMPPESSALLNLQADVTIRPSDVEPYLFIQDLTNTQFTWEKLREFNVGLDFAMWNDRVSTFLNFYTRNAYDLVGVVQTSGIGGQGLKAGNFADMESYGYEISLSTLNAQRGDFQWRTNFNFGYTNDRITKLDFGPRFTDVLSDDGDAVLGKPRRALYSTRFAGLNEQGIPQFYDGNNEIVFNYDLQDRQGLDGVLVYEGPTEPRGSGGLNNSFSYKGLTLNVLLSFKYDYKLRLNNQFYGTYTDFEALPGELNNRWAVPGDENNTNIPAILDRNSALSEGDQVMAYYLYNLSNVRVADGDYIRLKTVNLSYQLPQTWVSRWGLSSARLSLEGQNLMLLYSDKRLRGQDPEFFLAGGTALPQPRLVTFSLNVGF